MEEKIHSHARNRENVSMVPFSNSNMILIEAGNRIRFMKSLAHEDPADLTALFGCSILT